jgi:hypothetical protein
VTTTEKTEEGAKTPKAETIEGNLCMATLFDLSSPIPSDVKDMMGETTFYPKAEVYVEGQIYPCFYFCFQDGTAECV